MVPVSSARVPMIKQFAALALLLLAVSGNAMAQGSDLLIQAPECRSGLYREISKYTIECVDRIDPDFVKRFCALRSPGDDAVMLACGALEKAEQ
jgi:hypothetical protein